jgi:3-oxoacyl-[acyl-carrier-protein] synthase II
LLAEPGPSPGEALQALDPNRSRRFDLFAALATAGAEHALGDGSADPAAVGMVMGVSHGHVERSVRFLGRAVERGPRLASPAEFPYLLPSMAAGNASVYLGLRGPVLVVSDPDATGESALHAAISLLQAGIADSLLSGSVAIGDPVVARAIASLGLGSEEDWNGHASAWVLLEAAPSAAARRAPCHARVIAAVTLDHGADGSALVEEPRDRERARLVHLGTEGPRAEARLARAMAGSAWLEVPRVRVAQPRGGHDAWGVTALAAAACLLRRGIAREAMVWTAGQHSSSLVQLQASAG